MTIKPLHEKSWGEVAVPIQICELNKSILEFVKEHKLTSFNYEEDGLGIFTATIFQIDSTIYWASGLTGNDESCTTLFQVRSFGRNTKVAVLALCRELNIELQELEWVSEELGIATWSLSRYDDNGNEIEMFRFHKKEVALAMQEVFEKRGHKQIYFVGKKL